MLSYLECMIFVNTQKKCSKNNIFEDTWSFKGARKSQIFFLIPFLRLFEHFNKFSHFCAQHMVPCVARKVGRICLSAKTN